MIKSRRVSVSAISDEFCAFKSRIADREVVVGVIGLGYVGLPLISLFADRGFGTLGFDIDPEKISKLCEGQPYLQHLDGATFKRFIDSGSFEPTTDYARIGEV